MVASRTPGKFRLLSRILFWENKKLIPILHFSKENKQNGATQITIHAFLLSPISDDPAVLKTPAH